MTKLTCWLCRGIRTAALPLLLVLAGCGPSVVCEPNVPGDVLLKSLSEPSLPFEDAAKNTVQLLAACTLSKEQQDSVDKVVGRIAAEAPLAVQADFYSKLSDKAPSSKVRLDFISLSTAISGTAKATQEPLTLVEFEQLGKPFDRKTASPQLFAALKSIGEEEGDPELVRQVDTEIGPVVFVRSVRSENFSESSYLRIYELNNGRRLPTPTEGLNYILTGSSDNAFNDYFFSCGSLAGGNCGTRDSRYALNSQGKLKYIASVLYNAQEDGNCGIAVTASQLKAKAIEPVVALAEQQTVKCTSPPTPDAHGDAFKVYSEQALLLRITEKGSYPNLAELVSFKRKDAADSALLAKLLAQGATWRAALFERAIEYIDVKPVASSEEAFNQLRRLADQSSSDLANLKWLLSTPPIDPDAAAQVSQRESEIELIRIHIKMATALKAPTPVVPKTFPYISLTIAIGRQPQVGDPAVFSFPESIPQTPYAYFGIRVDRSEPSILYSYKPITNRGVVTLLVIPQPKSANFFVGGMSHTVPLYKSLSDNEFAEYKNYYKLVDEYQQQMTAYNRQIETEREKIGRVMDEIRRVDVRIGELAERAQEQNVPSPASSQSPKVIPAPKAAAVK